MRRATLLDGQCQDYKTLYRMLIFGPKEGLSLVPGGLGRSLMKEYITDRPCLAKRRNTGFTKLKLHDGHVCACQGAGMQGNPFQPKEYENKSASFGASPD